MHRRGAAPPLPTDDDYSAPSSSSSSSPFGGSPSPGVAAAFGRRGAGGAGAGEALPNSQAAADRVTREMQSLSKALSESIEREIFKPLADRLRQTDMREMFQCSLRCTEDPPAGTERSFTDVQRCIESCNAPFQRKLNEVSSACQREGQQVNGCIQDCAFPLQSSPGGFSDAQAETFVLCARECASRVDYDYARRRLISALWPK